MPVTVSQIELYALTKQLMEVSEKYTLTTLSSEKITLLEDINVLYDKLDKLKVIYKEETK
jgi:hypothetical protein